MISNQAFDFITSSLTLSTIFSVLLWRYIFDSQPSVLAKSWGEGSKSIAFFGTYLEFFWRPMQDIEMERYKAFGKVYGVYDGTQPGLIVGDPELISTVMLGTTGQTIFCNRRAVKTTHPVMGQFLSSLEGDDWKRVRRIIAPTFSPKNLRTLLPIMHKASDSVLHTLGSAADTGVSVNLKDLFGDYTMAVISRCAFATEPTGPFVDQASRLFTFPFWRKFLDYVMPKWFLDSLGFTVLPKFPMDFFRIQTERVIAERAATEKQAAAGEQEATGDRPADFLQLLLDARDQPSSDTMTVSSSNSTPQLAPKRTPPRLTIDEVFAQSVLFFSVGYETSSQVLMYTAYCLATNPEAQQRLAEEIASADCNDFETLQALPYLNAVINESLRLYNPVLRMERRASEDFKLGDVAIKQGMIVGIPVWDLHHSEEYFPDPWQFQPGSVSA